MAVHWMRSVKLAPIITYRALDQRSVVVDSTIRRMLISSA